MGRYWPPGPELLQVVHGGPVSADGGHGLAGEGFKDRRVGFGPEVDDQLATIHAVQQ